MENIVLLHSVRFVNRSHYCNCTQKQEILQQVKEHKHDVHKNFILWTLMLTYIQSFFSHHLRHCLVSESYNNVIFSGCQQEINFQMKRDVI